MFSRGAFSKMNETTSPQKVLSPVGKIVSSLDEAVQMKIQIHSTLAVVLFLPFLGSAQEASSREVKSLTEGTTVFALDLYKQLSAKEGNLFFSPVGISTTLAMAYVGARGSTALEMATSFHFDLEQSKFHAAVGASLHSAQNDKTAHELHQGSILWLQRDFTIIDSFRQILRDDYDATVESVDFKSDLQGACEAINRRVQKQTGGKIKNLLSPDALSPDTRLVLTNAIYFHGLWSLPFNPKKTKPDDFEVTPGHNVRIAFMHLDADFAHFKYLETESFQALEMPYRDSASATSAGAAGAPPSIETGQISLPTLQEFQPSLSMIVFLPKKHVPLAIFEQSLTLANLTQWFQRLSPTAATIFLKIPKFTAASDLDLTDVLKAMGARLMFSPQADFSGMSTEMGLSVSAIRHKAYVSVDEIGTEAAAATSLSSTIVSCCPPPPTPIYFSADRPFLYLIRDNRTGGILFFGRLTDPSKL